MSTRCQVRVEPRGANEGGGITLYRHCDGYPSSILPSLAAAYKTLNAHTFIPCPICEGTGKRAVPPKLGPGPEPCNGCQATGQRVADGAWQAGRAGKAAATIIAEGVQSGDEERGPYVAYEPEDSHDLHGDIEYYYVVSVGMTKNGSGITHPTWTVTVFVPKDEFWGNCVQENLRVLAEGDVLEMAEQAGSL